jgi:DNA-binding MurR/RpiR family transcriptional regulator
MDLTMRLEQHRDRLTPADRRVLEVLLSHPTEAAFLRAEEVADRAGVHQAAATRLAQRLGFDGYPGLRAALQADLLGGIGPGERVRQRLEHAEGADLIQSVVQDELASLSDLPRHVTQAELDDVASRIVSARRAFLFAHGNATVLVELMHRRLRRFGVDTVVLGGSGRDIAESLLGLSAEDVVLAFAFLREPAALAPLLGYAAERGAGSIVVTDTLGALHPAPSVLLAAPRGSGREFQSLTVPMAIANALVLTIARRSADSSLSSLDRLGSLLERFQP